MDRALGGLKSISDLSPRSLCYLGQVTLMLLVRIMALFTEHLLCCGSFAQVMSSMLIAPNEVGWVGHYQMWEVKLKEAE